MRHKKTRLALVALMSVALVSACTSSQSSESATGSSEPSVLRMAFSYDQGSLDPDVFYGAEGANITMSAYEGLVRYKGDSTTTIEPLLATEWTVSPNGLVYTFTLRDGVEFQDGTKMDSSTWKAAIERRQALEQGSSYMVGDVVDIGTPDPETLVLTLSQPDNAFLTYLASPYGVKAINPKVFTEQDVDGDLGSAWLANNTAGTGPYQLASATPGQSYELAAYDGYWGEKPGYSKVQISTVPSFTTQQLQLERGELDFVYHGIPFGDLPRYANDDFQTLTFDSIVRLNLWINPGVEPLTNPAVRAAVAKAIDRATIISQVYGDTAKVADQMFPVSALPQGEAAFTPTFDPSELSALAPTLSSNKIDLAYTTDDALNAQVAQLVQTQLAAAGLDVTTRGVTQQTTFAWPGQPDGRPSMLILPANPDTTHPSAWSTLFYAKNGGLSYFAPDNVAAPDQLVLDGLRMLDQASADSAFATAGDQYRESGNYIPLADLNAVVVSRKGICNWEHDFSVLWAFRLQSLKECP